MKDFFNFLKRNDRSASTAERAIAYVKEFEQYLKENCTAELNVADNEDLETIVAWVEQKPNTSAKGYLWGIGFYYAYSSNEEMRCQAGILREQRIDRRPFVLSEFRVSIPKM